MYFSIEPMVTASKPVSSVQAPSHRRSCGQTRPQISGSGLVSCASSAASNSRPSRDQRQPVRDVVVHRALPLAVRIAAIQAARRLLDGLRRLVAGRRSRSSRARAPAPAARAACAAAVRGTGRASASCGAPAGASTSDSRLAALGLTSQKRRRRRGTPRAAALPQRAAGVADVGARSGRAGAGGGFPCLRGVIRSTSISSWL